jgi:methylated-DNA-[protein]-cysteine S-methyltransferase
MTSFSKKVLKIVLSIPLGQTRSYKWVAKKAGKPRAYRAVGTILNKNPWPLIIPCHRVIKDSRQPGGYSRGKIKKKLLLALEQKIVKCLQSKE